MAAGEALLCSLCYSAPKANFHYMVWEALRQSLDNPFKKRLILFNDARNKRADAFYDRASVTSETEFKEIFEESKKFAHDRIKKESPDLGKMI